MSDSNPSHPDREVPRVSYAQNREDILLDRLFGEHVGRYMDVGSCHPILDSNTHFFYERGWRGVNLEPRVSSFHSFLDQRPEDLNLNLAASDFDGELLFYEVDTTTASRPCRPRLPRDTDSAESRWSSGRSRCGQSVA